MPIATCALPNWRLKDFDEGVGESMEAFSATLDADDWIDIAAPGDVYLALHRVGRLPHPFSDRAEEDCAWVRDREWWQRADFDAPDLQSGQRLILEFEGLDTLATVWLNGKVIGRSDNMFRSLKIDITGEVRDGSNQLAIRFDPMSRVEVDGSFVNWGIQMAGPRNFVRKAQFGWGWDWGPNLPTVGIWKPVTLRVEQGAAIRSVKFTTLSLNPARDLARASVDIEADVFSEGMLSASIVLTGPDGAIAAQSDVDLIDGKGRVELNVSAPLLWWTPELGKANLYALSVALKAEGSVIDQNDRRVGIRSIELDQSIDPDEAPATFFRFKLNGISIFARGACWIPASTFVSEVDEDHYRRLLEPAVRANMNMMRIWGGGVYEHDAFYDLCDEMGLLVWQDFMFACAPYPETEDLAANIEAEIRFQIERLRHHPSLALWCANNENQILHEYFKTVLDTGEQLPGDLYYHRIMPAAVADLDPTTPYVPGSPFGGPVANSMQNGDVHHWTVWHGIPLYPVDEPVGALESGLPDISPEGVAYTRYAEDNTRFVSEYGIHGAPAMETLRRVLPEDQRALGSPGLVNIIKDKVKDKINAMMVTATGLPTDFEDYVDLTQLLQAEGLKFGIEHFRRRTPHCSGSLIWQYNDCWPCVSWSLIDYNGFGKASLFYVGRAYAPVMASFKILDDGSRELWIVNDGMNPVSGTLRLELHDFSGELVWSDDVDYEVAGTTSSPVWRGMPAGSPSRVLRVASTNAAFPENYHFFAPIKDLDRPQPVAPDVRMEQRGPSEVAVHVTANDYIWFVHLLVSDEATVFSDNYIDIPKGETRTLIVTKAGRPIHTGDITVRWR